MTPPASVIYQALGVLDAKTYRKGFCFNMHATLIQDSKGIARTVTQCHHSVLRRKLVALLGCDIQHRQT